MRKIKNPIARAGIHILLFVWVFYSVIPFLWTVLTSLKLPVEANSRTPKIFGFEATFDNYASLWLKPDQKRRPFTYDNFIPVGIIILVILVLLVAFYFLSQRYLKLSKPKAGLILTGILLLVVIFLPNVAEMSKSYDYFVNSIIVTFFTLVISISIGCLGGYAIARYDKIWGVVILIAALAFRALPRMAFVLPYYYLGNAINLYDTKILLIMILVAVNQPFTIWMLRSFFMDIPKELEEAAMIDGAGRLQSFFRVILPITWPGIITTSLFTLLLAYNEFLLPRILTQSNWTFPVQIASYTSGEDAAYKTVAAAASVSITLPLIFIIVIFQKRLVKGLSVGAVKG